MLEVFILLREDSGYNKVGGVGLNDYLFFKVEVRKDRGLYKSKL